MSSFSEYLASRLWLCLLYFLKWLWIARHLSLSRRYPLMSEDHPHKPSQNSRPVDNRGLQWKTQSSEERVSEFHNERYQLAWVYCPEAFRWADHHHSRFHGDRGPLSSSDNVCKFSYKETKSNHAKQSEFRKVYTWIFILYTCCIKIKLIENCNKIYQDGHLKLGFWEHCYFYRFWFTSSNGVLSPDSHLHISNNADILGSEGF